MAATSPRRRVCNGREAPEDVGSIGRNCSYGESIDVKCQSRIVTGKKFRWTRQRDKDSQAQGPRTEHLFVLPECRRSSRQKRSEHLCFPRADNGSADNGSQQEGDKQQRYRSLGSQEHGPDSLKPFSQDRSLQKWRHPLGTEASGRITRKAEPCRRSRSDKGRGRKDLSSLFPQAVHEHKWKKRQGKSRERKKRGWGRAPTHRASSGARRTVRRAGP